jgi:hypothetical protein
MRCSCVCQKLLLGIGEEVGLETNVQETKHMFISYNHNAGQNRIAKVGKKSFRKIKVFEEGGR